MLYWKHKFCAHSDRARRTGQETQNSLSYQIYICNKVRNSGKLILYSVIFFVVVAVGFLFFFPIHDKRKFKLFSILGDSLLHREDPWINVIHKLLCVL